MLQTSKKFPGHEEQKRREQKDHQAEGRSAARLVGDEQDHAEDRGPRQLQMKTAYHRRPKGQRSFHHTSMVTGSSMKDFEGGEQLGAERAIDRPIVNGERHAHHGGDLQLSFLTIGRFSAGFTAARMLACGGLITALNCAMPYMPRLEIALVPP